MCGYCCVAFIGFLIESKNLLDYTNLFSTSEYKKSDNIIQKFFQ